jgi:single-strand DNA-binding protein
MASFNRVIIVGNLTRDPELRQLPSGQNVCRLGLASNRQYRNKQTGDVIQEVCFIDVDVWGGQAESCKQYLSKGRLVLVEGRLKFDTWQAQDGTNRSKHSVVADRVVFMAGASVEQETVSEEQKLAVQEETLDRVRALAAQQDNTQFTAAQKEAPVKGRKKKDAVETTAAEGASAVAFQDEPPFQDDLPF